MPENQAPLPDGYPNDLPPVELREITRETYRPILRLKVTEPQKKFVATNSGSLAQAHYHPEARPFGLYAGELLVGFVMFSLEEVEQGNLWVWRFMIGAQHQGKGFGRQGMDAVQAYARGLGGIKAIKLSHVDKLPGHPGPFYASLGFEYTGEEDEGELIMRRALRD